MSESGSELYLGNEKREGWNVREPLHELIYRLLKERLIIGQFLPGQKMPLRGLAKEIGVSLIPVRDALQRLESIGALEAQSGQAMSVPHLSEAAILEIREVRISLESLAVRRICARRDPAAVEELAGIAAELCAATERGDLREFLRWNWRFHMGLALASGSQTIVAALEPLWPRMGPSIGTDNPSHDDVVNAGAVHIVIVDALKRWDAEAAIAVLTDDINDQWGKV